MTKDQYIESLVAQGGLSSKEMYAMTKEWEAKNKPQEKVKEVLFGIQTIFYCISCK